jgi:hypothetical protein
MPHNKHLGKQGCSYWFCHYKIFKPCKSRSVKLHPSDLFMNNCIRFCIVICCQFVICYLSVLFVILPVVSYLHSTILLSYLHAFLLSVQSVVLFSRITQCSITQCYFCPDTGSVPGISIHIKTTIRQVNKHHSTRPAPAFVLVYKKRAYYNHRH